MNFTIELTLNEVQKRELYRLGKATKKVYNYAIERLDVNFNKTKRILSYDVLLDEINEGKLDDEQVLKYSSHIFKGVIQVAIGAYRSYILEGEKKPYPRVIDEFAYALYFDNSLVELNYDGLILKDRSLMLNVDENSSDFFLRAKKSKILFVDKDVRNVKMRYDGIYYFLYGEIVGNKKGKPSGLMLDFDKKYFLTSPSGLKIEKLTKNDAFVNKCFIIKDLEESIQEKVSKNRKVYDAEYNSLDFTKKQVKVYIDNFIREIIKEVFDTNPGFICVNFIDYNRYCSSMKEKVNLYLLKTVRSKLSRICKAKNIEYIIAPTHQSEELYQTIAI